MGTTTDDLGARTVDVRFLQMICNDEELLAAEFEAIIAAEWPAPPAPRGEPGATTGAPAPADKHRVALPIDRPVARPRHPGVGGWAHQRSPPLPSTSGRR